MKTDQEKAVSEGFIIKVEFAGATFYYVGEEGGQSKFSPDIQDAWFFASYCTVFDKRAFDFIMNGSVTSEIYVYQTTVTTKQYTLK